MSLDDLPPLLPTNDPGGAAFIARVIAEARRVLATTRCVTDLAYRPDDYWQKLDIFMPERNDGGALPVFCFFHGGGWFTGHKEWVTFMAPALLAAPAIFVTPSYRHAPAARFPAQLDDCADAVAWIHCNIATYGGDPGRIHLGGHSAGAHLASLTALRRDELAKRGLPGDVIKACYPVSGRTDLCLGRRHSIGPVPGPGGAEIIESFLATDAQRAAASPLEHVAGNRTPFYIAVGSADLGGFALQARVFADALRAAGSIAEHEEFAGYDHFMMSERCGRLGHPWMDHVHAWLRRGAG
jgi:acetyl esterase/lipase